MKNLQCQCENPAIILNPHLKDIILKYGHYYIRGKRCKVGRDWFDNFPWSKFGIIKRSISSPEDNDTCYVLDENYEHWPLFMYVPCGKCIICRDRKANEWVTRAMCETQYSSNVPYFVTLTYNDLHCPKNGVRKRSCQLFMKRLRVNFERYVGHPVNLRFFLCAEYGSKYHRPHYHLLLWNVPLLMKNHLVDIIERSWSFRISKEDYDRLPDTRDSKSRELIYKFYDKERDVYRGRYGFIKVSECDENRVRYSMKYMRKDCEIPIKSIDSDTGEICYMNDTFFLSSRRCGIGRQWIEDKKSEYRKYPDIMDVRLTDKFTGESYAGIMPRYFKDIVAPPPCKIIKKEIRDTFRLWNYVHNECNCLIGADYSFNTHVLSHYPTLPAHRGRVKVTGSHSFRMCDNFDEYNQYCRDKFQQLYNIEHELLSYDYDVELCKFSQEYKKRHMVYVELYIKSCPEVSVADKAAFIRRRRERSKLREVL